MPTLETTSISAMPFVKQSRVIRAERSKVYAAWTQPEIFKQWFGPGNRYCSSAVLNVHEGGLYSIEVRLNPGEPLPPNARECSGAEGVYTEVVPNEKLQFTWKPTWNPGEESLVTVTFADAQGGTEVTILHERISNDDSCQGYNQGWASALDKLSTHFSA